MVAFKTSIQKFNKKGEKTGWTYIVVPAHLAQKLIPGNKKSFTVKGKLDSYSFHKKSLLPMGGGDFILPLNHLILKFIKKTLGEILFVELEEDKSAYIFNSDLTTCLNDAPSALSFFNSLTPSHQKYFSKWIDSAKTDSTKIKRITQAINSLSIGWCFSDMLRAQKNK